MKNSRSLSERTNEYKLAGWEIRGMKAIKTTIDENGIPNITIRDMAPAGEYDTFLPLPDNIREIEEGKHIQHDRMVRIAIETNQQIDVGATEISIPLDIPSEWIDWKGLERNQELLRKALRLVREEITRKPLYVRIGKVFKKISEVD